MTQKNRRSCMWPGLSGILLIALLVMAISGHAFGQGDPTTASLRGTITDPSGARIDQATVVLTSPEKGITRTAQVDKDGGYSFGLLPPASYTLAVKAPGFKMYKQSGITLDPGQSASQDVAMTLGGQQEEVVVTAQAPLLQTTDSNISADINSKQVVELPLNLRNIIGLAELNSSVNNTSQAQCLYGGGAGNANADQDISFMSFSGGYFGSSAFMLDGIWDTGGDWGPVIYVPSPDAVQEFKIQNNSFTAQYGWSTGNVIDVVTKSGTSQFHGSGYEFYRNSAMDANLWFANHNGQAKPSFDRNQFGVSAGGPMYIPGLYKRKDKTFIFGLFERLASATPGFETDTVPTAAFRTGDLSALLGSQVGLDALGRPILSGQIYDPQSARQITAGQVDSRTGRVATATGYIRDPIAGNKITAINSLMAKMISYYPTPAPGSGLTNNFTASASDANASNEYSVRVDHNINDNNRIFARYSYKKEYKVGTPTIWGASDPAGPGNMRPNNRYNATAGFSHVFSQTLSMNAVAGFEHWGEASTNQSLGLKPSTLGLPGYLDTFSYEFPIVNIASQTSLGPRAGVEYTAYRPTGSAAVDFVKTHGTHTISFGFMGVDVEYNQSGVAQTTLGFDGGFTQGPDPDNPTANTGNGFAQALLGVLDGSTNTGPMFVPAISKKYEGLYLQDGWRFTPKLTLNLGIRQEIQFAPTYRHNTGEFFDPLAANPLGLTMGTPLQGALIFTSPDHRGTYDTNYKNLAPRVGFSYNLIPKLVMRGGYGVFFPTSAFLNQTPTDGFSVNTNTVAALSGSRVPNPAVSVSNPWPQGLRTPTGNSLGMLEDVGYGIGGAYFRSRRSGYVEQYMLGFQYAFRDNDVLDVSYVGSTGKHQYLNGLNVSQLDPKYLSLGTTALNHAVANPYFGYIKGSGCSLDQPTVAQSQLLHPYSQYCNVGENAASVAFANYNSLQVNFNHRFSQGLNLLVSYTFSKFIDNAEGTNNWSYTGNSGPANNYNLAAEKSVDAGDIPHALVVNYIYQLPIGRNKTIGGGFNRATDAVLGGWQVSGITTIKAGIPLGFSGNNINSYGGNPRPDVIGNVHASNRSINEWFNTGAVAYAKYGTFGTASRFFSNLRGPGYQNWDLAIMKNWTMPRETRLQFRAELFNAFNHPNFYTPNTGYGGCDPNTSSSCSSSFGKITNTFFARDVQMAAKYYW